MMKNVLQHNGKYPCSRCYVIFNPKEKFPLLLSDELQLRDSSEIPNCIQKLRELRSKSRNKTELKSLTNYNIYNNDSSLLTDYDDIGFDDYLTFSSNVEEFKILDDEIDRELEQNSQVL